MSKYLESLIFDRTVADIQMLTDKAYIDYNDLNRVESAVKRVSYLLNCYGYRNNTVNKLNWKPEDKRSDSEMERLRNNINEIRRAYYAPSDTPLTPDKITYTSIYQANFIEKIIYDIGNLVEKSFPGQQHLAIRLGKGMIGNRGERT